MPTKIIRRLMADNTGVAATEYGLIAMLIAVAAAAAIGSLGSEVNEHYGLIDDAVRGAGEE